MEADLIYDVGMNRGDDTACYLSKGYRGVAFDVVYTWRHYRFGHTHYGKPDVCVWHDVHATRASPVPGEDVGGALE